MTLTVCLQLYMAPRKKAAASIAVLEAAREKEPRKGRT